MVLKVISRNVAGLSNQSRLHQVINMARSYDIICLQDTKITINQAPFIRAKWGSDHVFISSTGVARRGAITLFHQRTSPTHLYVHSNPQGQFIINVAVIKMSFMLWSMCMGTPTQTPLLLQQCQPFMTNYKAQGRRHV